MDNAKLFVGNISYQTTDEELTQFFASAGKVESAKIITDKMSGRSKGFGFVEMSSADEAKTAQETLDGKELGGRPVAVKEAKPQESRGDGQKNW